MKTLEKESQIFYLRFHKITPVSTIFIEDLSNLKIVANLIRRLTRKWCLYLLQN
jgi:hypothetical protein